MVTKIVQVERRTK